MEANLINVYVYVQSCWFFYYVKKTLSPPRVMIFLSHPIKCNKTLSDMTRAKHLSIYKIYDYSLCKIWTYIILLFKYIHIDVWYFPYNRKNITLLSYKNCCYFVLKIESHNNKISTFLKSFSYDNDAILCNVIFITIYLFIDVLFCIYIIFERTNKASVNKNKII